VAAPRRRRSVFGGGKLPTPASSARRTSVAKGINCQPRQRTQIHRTPLLRRQGPLLHERSQIRYRLHIPNDPRRKAANLEALKAEYYERFHPINPTQRLPVDTLIDSEWLLRRFRVGEANSGSKARHPPFAPTPTSKSPKPSKGNSGYFARLQCRIDSAYRNYRPRAPGTPPPTGRRATRTSRSGAANRWQRNGEVQEWLRSARRDWKSHRRLTIAPERSPNRACRAAAARERTP
jgi:hypothetical protein